MAEIIGKECKFVVHLHKIADVRDDIHVIKERIHYDNGSTSNNLKIVKNFKRPFYITKEHYQKYKDKKESEELSRVNEYYSTESELGKNIAMRLGSRYNGVYKLRDVRDNPYIYGIDTKASTIIKKMYIDKYPDVKSDSTVAVLDIEADIIKDKITICTLAMYDKIYTVYTKEYRDDKIANKHNIEERIDYLYDKYVPDTEIKKAIKPNVIMAENEYELIKLIFKKAHEWQPDFVAIWNIAYDIPFIVRTIEKYGGDPKDIFSDPSLPPEYRHFRYVEGMKQKLTESGVYKPVNPEEQWHTVETPASFYLIDAMSTHRYVRVGGKSTPGGYSLDNILEQELGEKLKKLKFGDEDKYKGIEWHQYMVENKPLEYIVYNMWDCMSMLELDRKTKDLSVVMPMLSGPSSYGIFNSGPKKIVDGMHFFYLSHNKVLGSKPTIVKDNKILGLGDWIVLLPSYRIANNGLRCVIEDRNTRMNTRAYTYDIDCVSSYPSDTMAANVSKDTTRKELIDIDGIEKEEFKKQNINLFFGEVNTLEYVSTMYNAPTLNELDTIIDELMSEDI